MQDFAGAGNHVYAYGAEHAAFGSRHVGIAWSHAFIDGGSGFGSVSQRAPGLGAADGPHAVYAAHGGGSQPTGLAPAVRRGRSHDASVGSTSHCARVCLYGYVSVAPLA